MKDTYGAGETDYEEITHLSLIQTAGIFFWQIIQPGVLLNIDSMNPCNSKIVKLFLHSPNILAHRIYVRQLGIPYTLTTMTFRYIYSRPFDIAYFSTVGFT